MSPTAELTLSSEIRSEVGASVWKLLIRVGDSVEAGAEVAILESMKMEIPIVAETPGTITEVLVAEGDTVDEGQLIARLESN